MRKSILSLVSVLLTSLLMFNCSSNVSFAEMKESEKASIANFITEKGIKVISLEEFYKNDTTTDVSKNEYVLFPRTGVYMQIVRKGEGSRIASGTSRKVLCRFVEQSLASGDTLGTNLNTSSIVDVMMVTNSSNNYSGTFTSGYMIGKYTDTNVPAGWLVPMNYIYLSRNIENLAKVRLIVPYDQGTSAAQSSVVACYYDITYEKGF